MTANLDPTDCAHAGTAGHRGTAAPASAQRTAPRGALYRYRASGLCRDDAEKVEIAIANQRRVQNHIQGVHAAAMTLLAETATGMVVGMNVRDDCLPLAKELKVQFKRRTQGDMRAVAHLSAQQRKLMQSQDKGEVVVPVTVTDASGEQPIVCEFIWAWVPAKKSTVPNPASVPA
jgi:acyl-coenzyme A thioesterase PaaI-like protein